MVLQSRLHESSQTYSSRSNRLLVRPAVRYWLMPELQVWFGYAWTPNFSPFRNENRFWQQLFWIQSIDSQSTHQHRLRFEERLIQNTPSVAYRLRYLPRWDRWFTEEKKLGFVVWDEFFWNLNSVTRGPSAGFDQNRFFVGPMIALSADHRLEIGYLNLYLTSSKPQSDVMAHILGMYYFMNF